MEKQKQKQKQKQTNSEGIRIESNGKTDRRAPSNLSNTVDDVRHRWREERGNRTGQLSEVRRPDDGIQRGSHRCSSGIIDCFQISVICRLAS